MSNGKGRLVLELPEKLKETVEGEEVIAQKEIPGEPKWVDKKLVASELKEISKRFEQIKIEKEELEKDIEALTEINAPKKASEVHLIRKGVNQTLNDASKINLGITVAQAIGGIIAVTVSGTGLLIAGAAGVFGLLGGVLSGKSVQSKVDGELIEVQRGVQVLDKMNQLRSEISNFESERASLIQRRGELVRLFGEETFLDIPIKLHISRVRKILKNIELIKEANKKFLKTLKPREVKKLRISEARLRELHDSALERTYVQSDGGIASRESFIKNIAKELAIEIALRKERVSNPKELSLYGLGDAGKLSKNFERTLANLEFISSSELSLY
jgi:hypothetical protein